MTTNSRRIATKIRLNLASEKIDAISVIKLIRRIRLHGATDS